MIATVWLRNTLLVQLTIILGIAVLLLLPRLLFPLFGYWPEAGNGRWTTVFLFILGVAGISGNNLRLDRDKISSQDDDNHWYWPFLAGVCLLIAAYVIGLRNDFDPFKHNPAPYGFTDLILATSIAFLLVVAGFFLLPGVMKLKVSGNMEDNQ